MTNNAKNQFRYDDAQNLTCSDCSSKAVHYKYDTDNLRVRQVKSGLNTYFIYARNGNLVMEYTPGKGEYKNHVYLGGKQIATVKKTGSTFDIDKDGRYDWSEIGQYPGYVSSSTDTTYLNTDVVGSPVVATDRYGNTKWTQNYFPYGERRIKSAANAGKEHR